MNPVFHMLHEDPLGISARDNRKNMCVKDTNIRLKHRLISPFRSISVCSASRALALRWVGSQSKLTLMIFWLVIHDRWLAAFWDLYIGGSSIPPPPLPFLPKKST